jgi:spermidine/putrescine transport system permease protein
MTSLSGDIVRNMARRSRWLTPLAFLASPTAFMLAFFAVPLGVLVATAFQHSSLYSTASGFTLDNFRTLLTDPLYRRVTVDTVVIATTAMVIQLVIALPLSYVLAFRAGALELPLLLALVVVDELNPIVRIYSWRMLLGREGIINDTLRWLGIIDRPLDWLLFTKFSVVVVLATSWVNYTVLPLYASMKAIDPSLLDEALDLGAGWRWRWRSVLLPLVTPGLFVAVILVYIPLFTDFATPGLVGGPSSYMLGNCLADSMMTTGDWGVGSALALVMLAAMGLLSAASFFLTKLKQIE